ncbi:SIR2 family NAD-dependent protein deacylase [Sandaracinus amylolyticus]|uniref:SIR2 family NAD-dependent protein deacylase n=1 Tax=Sandaracinus amylolyticus TaxID=927083 RepID=UPI001F33E5D7|nr:Sir2 family NAD-dependent protein deacetylase [Sandaracinus amylolyticus]UJR78291.1 Iron dicitrate transport regulator FecR [Sandaracinus amylolyticus]
MTLEPQVLALLDDALSREGPLLFLTGAGISAESGIPTFRGPEGYWTIGSKNYRAEELATYDAFTRMPEEVWAWYLYRRSVCRAASANAAHLALVELERALGDRFLLVTQNVDGLHLRAGNTLARTFQIHGNIDYLRCEDEHPRIREIPAGIALEWPKTRRIDDAERALLQCCGRGRWSRPHVLWFDESYDEPLFRFESSMDAVRRASLVVVIGTSGATTLPSHIVNVAAHRRVPMLVVNQDESPFTQIAERLSSAAVLRGTATQYVPAITRALIERA